VKRPANRFSLLLLPFLLAILVVVASGCSSVEPDNASSRPWNSPQSWESGGIPGGMMQGR
jgi:hypothetical protein